VFIAAECSKKNRSALSCDVNTHKTQHRRKRQTSSLSPEPAAEVAPVKKCVCIPTALGESFCPTNQPDEDR